MYKAKSMGARNSILFASFMSLVLMVSFIFGLI